MGRASFLRRAAATVVAFVATSVADVAWFAVPAWAKGDDWEAQKALITDKDEFAAWVERVKAELDRYRETLGDRGQEGEIKRKIPTIKDELDAAVVKAASDLAEAKAFADRQLAIIGLVQLANAIAAAGIELYLALLALILARVAAALGGSGDALKLPWDQMNKCLEFIAHGLEHGNDADKERAKAVREIKKLKDAAKKAVEKGQGAKEALEALKQAVERFLQQR